MMKRQFNFGVDYIPESIPPNEWRMDLENIEKVGFNTIRTGVCAWPTCEPKPNTYDFVIYDKILDMCKEENYAGHMPASTTQGSEKDLRCS